MLNQGKRKKEITVLPKTLSLLLLYIQTRNG